MLLCVVACCSAARAQTAAPNFSRYTEISYKSKFALFVQASDQIWNPNLRRGGISFTPSTHVIRYDRYTFRLPSDGPVSGEEHDTEDHQKSPFNAGTRLDDMAITLYSVGGKVRLNKKGYYLRGSYDAFQTALSPANQAPLTRLQFGLTKRLAFQRRR
ncbi:MAG: hypothetical protein HC859_14180 [Bacteroidia bacterium]|nr:hypothetical protein [Bacteroidia bacterium]